MMEMTQITETINISIKTLLFFSDIQYKFPSILLALASLDLKNTYIFLYFDTLDVGLLVLNIQ